MTALSPTMERGTITEWHKKEGDTVKNGEILCEVETDKAVMEYEADFDGVLIKIALEAGGSAAVGDVIAVSGEAGEDYAALLGDAKPAEKPKAEPESEDKPKVEPESAEQPKAEAQPADKPIAETIPQGKGQHPKSSPLARRIAKAEGIDISSVKGSGTGGRIIKRDIENLSASPAARIKQGSSSQSGMRKVIAERLSASKFSAPHYYLTVAVDMSALLAAKKSADKKGPGKISLNSFLIKFIAEALKKHTLVNASWNNGNIIEFEDADIGFAVALKNGLITPVIRKAGYKGIKEIDVEFRSLAEKALSGKLIPAEYSSASFTISNLGSFGIEEFTAIINPPGSAILAVGAIIKQPVVMTDKNGDDLISVKPIMKMTMSCDHRVIDGAVGAAFLDNLKRMIEDPVEALM